MIKFSLKGTETAHHAVEWCLKNFETTDWEMWMSNRGWDIYDFEFTREHDATLFGIKWSEYM